MKLQIQNIEGLGNLERERIVLRASDTIDAEDYLVLACRLPKTPQGMVLGGSVPFSFWFGKVPLSKGDLLILYTKAGKRSEKTNPDGTKSQFVYWGKEEAIWDTNVAPALLHTDTFQVKLDDEATLEPEKGANSGS